MFLVTILLSVTSLWLAILFDAHDENR